MISSKTVGLSSDVPKKEPVMTYTQAGMLATSDLKKWAVEEGLDIEGLKKQGVLEMMWLNGLIKKTIDQRRFNKRRR